MRWEYRVHTMKLSGDDEQDGQELTNIARPGIEEPGAPGWEIYAIDEIDAYKRRLHMKRPAQD